MMTSDDNIENEETIKRYGKFFKELDEFKKEQEKQKQRGLNDFNLLTIVRKYHDERYLHSAMIGALIDKDGKHYQGTLFLDIFLDTLGILDYDTQSSKVYTEQDYIDIYLTDGTKHIVIENKIWAGDQYEQIKRYIDTIKKDNTNLSPDDLYVVYLSTNRERPSKYSLGDLTIDNSNIIIRDGIKIAQYKAMHYKKHILDWLKECQKEVGNITNLNEVLRQYIEVVQMVNKEYKGKIMTMVDYMTNSENKENLSLAFEIDSKMDDIKAQVLFDLFEEIKENIEGKDKENKEKIGNCITEGLKGKNQLTMKKCKDLFNKGSNRPKQFGYFFDCFVDKRYLLFVKIATTGMYYCIITECQPSEIITKNRIPDTDKENFILMLKTTDGKNCGTFGDIGKMKELIKYKEKNIKRMMEFINNVNKALIDNKTKIIQVESK